MLFADINENKKIMRNLQMFIDREISSFSLFSSLLFILRNYKYYMIYRKYNKRNSGSFIKI